MILKKFYVYALLLTSVFVLPASLATELNMTSVGDGSSTVSRPAHGTSMDSVLQRFGEPESRLSAVGEPPITRWNYANFTVYFEHHLVIHSVVQR